MSKQSLVVANKNSSFATKGSVTIKDEYSIKCYFKEINNYPVLTVDEERELAERYLIDGDEVAKDKLIKSNLKFVISIAKLYQGKGLVLGDLINEGNIGLIKAIEKYDLSKNIKVISYAVWWIRQSINQALIEKSSNIRIPVNKRDSINRIKRIERDLESKLGRKPTENEIIEHVDSINVKCSKKELKVSDIRNINGSKFTEVSIDSPTNSEESEFTLLDVIPAETIGTQSNIEKFESELNELMSVLTKQEKNIIKMIFGVMVKEKIKLDDIALIYNVSKERIRQIKDTAIRKLRDNPNIHILFEYMHEM